ncbi:MAG: hypothetical protein KME38_20740 [Spirirestis rafaelensis WJT71-NPBG6]|nr:hypothetical protein [Spirirestis rafaelensis WJT71-NPBG6]
MEKFWYPEVGRKPPTFGWRSLLLLWEGRNMLSHVNISHRKAAMLCDRF